MKSVNFHLNYQTRFGEELCLHLVQPTADGGQRVHDYKMNTTDGLSWHYHLDGSVFPLDTTLDYFFTVGDGRDEYRREWTTITHRAELNAKAAQTLSIYNRWQAMPEDSYRYSSSFTDCINHCRITPLPQRDGQRTVRLTVRAPQLREGQRLVVVGNHTLLGAWNPMKALEMTQHNYHEWSVDIDGALLQGTTIEFKFAAKDEADAMNFIWEEGMNRTIEVVGMGPDETVEYELDQSFFAMTNQRLAGTLVPVFSLRSEGSFGVGDFGDLEKMIDWVKLTGQRVLQILPINDTTMTGTWQDSYPYNSNSIFALHPQYCDLRQLPALKDAKAVRRFSNLQKELNAFSQIDYERVNNAKNEYLHLIYNQEGKKALATKEFKAFFAENEHWLVPYAQYCLMRDTYKSVEFSDWKGHEQWDEADRKALSKPGSKEWESVAYYYYVQYVLATQMTKAHDHARQQSVVLKGDIPIGVSRNGSDVWMEPKYFNLNGQAGAPPDDFSVNGQNWGFPTYNWQAMIADGCQWWVRRFQNMAHYFDAYRIDHVLGFFRIWEIPIESVHGLLGQFAPSLGMTVDEIQSYGLPFNEDHFTKPFIADWTLDRIFGERAQEVRDKYLRRVHDDILELLPEYDTQRKIEAHFQGVTDEKELWLRDGLYSLVSDVLFVRDHVYPHLYHPRISAQLDFVYEALWDKDKAAFNRLYNDYFYRRNNHFWYNEAMRKLPIFVQSTRMLVCAEDLGMVPDCVEWVMNELRILSLEIQSMPKDPKVKFGLLHLNPYRSVATISSHDMPTLRMWWDEDWDRTQQYFNQALGQGGAAPHPLPDWLATDIIRQHLQSPSMLCILSIQDWLATSDKLRLPDATAERINIPANPRHYWRYRMHLSIEQLTAEHDFTMHMHELIQQSGR